jgi:hypothetical protein
VDNGGVYDDLSSSTQANLALSGRMAPTLRPMIGPWPGLVAITDTNALAGRACHSVRMGQPIERLFTSLAMTGCSPVYVAPHVVGELVRRLPEIADKIGVALAAARTMLWRPARALCCKWTRICRLGCVVTPTIFRPPHWPSSSHQP